LPTQLDATVISVADAFLRVNGGSKSKLPSPQQPSSVQAVRWNESWSRLGLGFIALRRLEAAKLGVLEKNHRIGNLGALPSLVAFRPIDGERGAAACANRSWLKKNESESAYEKLN